MPAALRQSRGEVTGLERVGRNGEIEWAETQEVGSRWCNWQLLRGALRQTKQHIPANPSSRYPTRR